MAKSSQDVKKLIEENKQIKAKLNALNVKVDDFIAGSDETKAKTLNELYAEFKAKEGQLPDVPPTPICTNHSHWDGTKCVCDPGYHDDGTGNCVFTGDPDPHPVPPIPTTGLLYDSNVDGKWNNGVARTVSGGKDGNIGANGKGLYTAASGSPKFIIDGKGVGTLETQPGFGRIYICVCNYNATLEYEFNIQSGTVDNLSEKTRSRHQMGGACENRFGGLGSHIAPAGEVGFKTEKCHNIQDAGQTGKLPKKIQLNTWYKSKYEYKDAPDRKSILLTRSIDFSDGAGFVKVLEGKETNVLPHYIDKAMFDKQSEFWLRLNGSGRISFKNIKLTAI